MKNMENESRTEKSPQNVMYEQDNSLFYQNQKVNSIHFNQINNIHTAFKHSDLIYT